MGFLWRFLRLYIPVVILVIVGASLFGKSELDGALARLQSEELLNARLGAGSLEGKVKMITTDLAYLASRPQLAAALDDPSAAELAALGAEFVAFAKVHSFYDQLRWIDETGMERVRVDYRPTGPTVIHESRLQNKGKRYFFTDAIKLSPGEVFISPLDLNIEQDKIEVPYKPMLRIATPVFDALGQKRGIVILNYLGAEILKDFAAATSTISDHVFLLNGEGYPLHAPNAGDAWGFMFKRPELSLANRSPQAWRRIKAEVSGQIRLADGLWTWQTSYPLLAGQRSSTGAADAIAPSRSELQSRAYVWKTVAFRPSAALDTLSEQVWVRIRWISAVILLFSAIGAARLAMAMAARAEAEESLRLANAGLEATVNERTLALTQSLENMKLLNARLADGDEALRSILEATQDGFWRVDQTGMLQDVNKAYCRLSGYAREELLGQGVQMLDANESLEELARHIQKAMSQGGDVFETRHRRKDGSLWDVEVSAIYTAQHGGTFFVFTRDISERKRIAATLQATGDRLREAQRIARLGNWEYDHRSGRLILSDEVYQLFELVPEGTSPSYEVFLERIHPEDRNSVRATFEKSLAERLPYETSHRLRMPDGRIKWVAEKGETSFDNTGAPRVSCGIVQDVTERNLAEEEIRSLAFYDTLTGLPNRRLFFDRMRQAIAGARRNDERGGLMYIDLDHFKRINDRLGHDIGDLLLQEAAARLKSCVREGDTVARLGGDEFVVMLGSLDRDPGVAQEQIAAVGRKILDRLGMPYRLEGHECSSTPSIGVALFAGDEESANEVVKRADQAMYRAKMAGRHEMCLAEQT